jgi:hypothetical protein
MFAALALMSQSATSTAAIAVMVTGPAPPIGAAVEDTARYPRSGARIAADQIAGQDMVAEDRTTTASSRPLKRGVADAVDALVGHRS